MQTRKPIALSLLSSSSSRKQCAIVARAAFDTICALSLSLSLVLKAHCHAQQKLEHPSIIFALLDLEQCARLLSALSREHRANALSIYLSRSLTGVSFLFRDGKPHLPVHPAEEGARQDVHRSEVFRSSWLGVSIYIPTM